MPAPSTVCVQAIGRLVIALAALIVATPAARAHHGASGFDPSKEVTVKGTVTAFVFTNPHVQVRFETIGDHGEKESWQGELTAPNKLARAGWNKRTLKPGDRVILSGYQAWRGERILWVRKIIGPDAQLMPLSGD